jgi:hypothetical protein
VSQAPPPPQSVPPSLSVTLPPPPPAGSPRFFALLYTQAALRPLIGTLLALADEISAGGARGLDHAVAHLRLDWWRGEAERYARGEPQHPWLRALLAQYPASRGLDLQPLVQAAALDLATQTLGAPSGIALSGANLQRALFELATDALTADRYTDPLPAQLQRTLGDLGVQVLELERFAARDAPTASAPAVPAAALEAVRRQAPAVDRALQPRLAPLLVWIALAAAQAGRSERRAARRPDGDHGSILDGFADNMRAWNAARRAARGRFRIE